LVSLVWTRSSISPDKTKNIDESTEASCPCKKRGCRGGIVRSVITLASCNCTGGGRFVKNEDGGKDESVDVEDDDEGGDEDDGEEANGTTSSLALP
jgi:hypothetical protein